MFAGSARWLSKQTFTMKAWVDFLSLREGGRRELTPVSYLWTLYDVELTQTRMLSIFLISLYLGLCEDMFS